MFNAPKEITTIDEVTGAEKSRETTKFMDFVGSPKHMKLEEDKMKISLLTSKEDKNSNFSSPMTKTNNLLNFLP